MQHVERLEFNEFEIEKFIEDKGAACPYCNSDIGQRLKLHSLSEDGKTVDIYCCCMSCEKKWGVSYTLNIETVYPLPYQEEF
jgi:hypothetical protein